MNYNYYNCILLTFSITITSIFIMNFRFGRRKIRLMEGNQMKFELKNCMFYNKLYSHHFNWKNIYNEWLDTMYNYKIQHGIENYNCDVAHRQESWLYFTEEDGQCEVVHSQGFGFTSRKRMVNVTWLTGNRVSFLLPVLKLIALDFNVENKSTRQSHII